jgi:hypothetical protein
VLDTAGSGQSSTAGFSENNFWFPWEQVNKYQLLKEDLETGSLTFPVNA